MSISIIHNFHINDLIKLEECVHLVFVLASEPLELLLDNYIVGAFSSIRQKVAVDVFK
jgi:hypothetical protein